MRKFIDAHIHIDKYNQEEQEEILTEMRAKNIDGLIAVSMDYKSAKRNLALAKKYQKIYPAIGYHPEQVLPTDKEIETLFHLIHLHKNDIVAIGEVGLPHYLRRENPRVQIEPYIELLELFLQEAARFNKPVALHAVYDEAKIVCDLLEKHSIKKAHFHWFKGDQMTINRMIRNGYFISITPDIIYKKRTEQLVRDYPLSQMMVETDGPWPFEGPYQDQMTHPKMLHDVIRKISEVKGKHLETVYKSILANTRGFYFEY